VQAQAAPAVTERRSTLPSPQEDVVLEHVSYAYEDGTVALRDVSLRVGAGEFVALLGQNGAGKSTLARHLLGLLRPAGGRVLIRGQDTRHMKVAELAATAGYVYQNPDHQIFAATVRDEVAFGLRNLGFAPGVIALRTDEVLARFDLVDQAATPPALLGWGQRRQVALASILAMQPQILILDEPTSGLDWRSRAELLEVITDFNAQGRTVLLITHDMRLVAEGARRAIVLQGGRVLFDGTARDLFLRPQVLAAAGLALPAVAGLARRLEPMGMPAGVLTHREFVAAWLRGLPARRRPYGVPQQERR
jgi:energy-coupling factor transport system ATP-binding protein